MEIKNFRFENFSLSYLLKKGNDKNKTPLILLHGFSGSAEDWLPFLNSLDETITAVALDLVGHGKSSSPKEEKYYSADSISAQIKRLYEVLGFRKAIIIGYSMGGRATLAFTTKFPELVSGLVLESTSFGIEDKKEKQLRTKQDEELAKFILESKIEDFVNHWLSLPIFETLKNLPVEKFTELKKAKLINSEIGLANILKGFSTGKMPYFLNFKILADIPILLIAGEKDLKYKKGNEKAAKRLPNSTNVVVENAGHNVHLEKPKEFIILTKFFLEKIWKQK